MKNTVLRKLKQSSAFTLAETMMAVLLLSIVFTAVGGGVVVMRNNYTNVILRAEQQTLLSTAVSAVSADLESAQQISTTGSGNTRTLNRFYSGKRNAFVRYGQGSGLAEGPADGEDEAKALGYLTYNDSIYVGLMQNLTGSGTDGLLSSSPLLSKATGTLTSSNSTGSENTRLRTVISKIIVELDDDGKTVKYFKFTITVTAMGAPSEYRTLVVKPYNRIAVS